MIFIIFNLGIWQRARYFVAAFIQGLEGDRFNYHQRNVRFRVTVSNFQVSVSFSTFMTKARSHLEIWARSLSRRLRSRLHHWQACAFICIFSSPCCVCLFSYLCLFHFQMFYWKTGLVDWLDDHHGPSSIVFDIAALFVCTDQLMRYCIFICSFLLADSYETINLCPFVQIRYVDTKINAVYFAESCFLQVQMFYFRTTSYELTFLPGFTQLQSPIP